jgi:hypothetical protein
MFIPLASICGKFAHVSAQQIFVYSKWLLGNLEKEFGNFQFWITGK